MNNPNKTKAYLLNVPLENDYKHTLYFPNKSSQQAFFASKVKDSSTTFDYQRKDNISKDDMSVIVVRVYQKV